MFYVYRHVRTSNNRPFYIGKGSKQRAFSKKSRNPYWKNIAKNGYHIQILKYFKSEKEALDFESKLIKLYKIYHLAEANMIDGGGLSGYKHTESSKSKIRKKAKERTGVKNNFYDKKHTLEAKNAISSSLTGRKLSKNTKLKMSKKVVCIKTQKTWNSIQEASKDLNINYSTLAKKLQHNKIPYLQLL